MENFDFAQMPPAKERRQLVLNAVAVIVPQRTMDSAGKLLKIDLRTLTDPQESANTCALVASILSLREV